ncbi:MAG: hypothetical protein ABIO80_03035 [Sphingomicrobium sp.]
MRAPFPSAVLPILAGVAALGACSTPGGPYPSLQPRAAEAIDPRVPVVRPRNDRPMTAGLAVRLAELIAQARQGQSAFVPLAEQAERLASAAGAPQSEGWVAAQQALSAAIAARGPTARALGDVDALGADALEKQRGIAPNDLDAIQQTAREVGAIDQRQSNRVKAMQRRLGI